MVYYILLSCLRRDRGEGWHWAVWADQQEWQSGIRNLEELLRRGSGVVMWLQELLPLPSQHQLTKPEESSIINLNVFVVPPMSIVPSQAIIFQLMNLKIDLAQVGGVRAAPNLYNLVFVEKNNYYYCNLLL